jgi:hypothetical protein
VFWWHRLWSTIAIVTLLTLALWGTIFAYVLYHPPVVGVALTTKYIEFDFAGYCFGLVAVAVSSAGVYFSLVVQPLSADMLKRIELHLMPKPFKSGEVAESICRPVPDLPAVERGPEIKIIHAAIRLARWATLEENDKKELLGPEGLNAGKLNFARGVATFEEQWDRQIVSVIATVICVIYVAVPFLYIASLVVLLISLLWSLYFLAILEAVVCASLYWRRWSYLAEFEKHLGGWAVNIDHYILVVETARVEKDKKVSH